MYHYKFLILEVWLQEFQIEVKELSSIISGRDWPPILQELMEITLEINTRYHERQKEKDDFQEENPELDTRYHEKEKEKNHFQLVSSHPQNSSSLPS
ncbi:hypothetical protein O181_126651 [Austropuccinia psidii MF-1]|uniref:Uncharacterized protein n=1 Tax=Austropuccinia psidii MF-1 TaxID=1389203 RepID=A0A9Q3KUN8_9BASI|nr:hypothetical protein [Austropuccinia psidii MF-1]